MPTKKDVFISAASCKKDIISGGHPKQFLILHISFGLSYLTILDPLPIKLDITYARSLNRFNHKSLAKMLHKAWGPSILCKDKYFTFDYIYVRKKSPYGL